MDTSTPVGKQRSQVLLDGLRRKAMENDCERNSSVLLSNDHKSSEEDAELVYSQPPNDTQLDRSDELFPFSPIPFRKEVPSTLLPLLDTPDIKWTSSLFTSYQAQSENASPEVLSEDNCLRTTCVDSHIDNNARYTTHSYFNSDVPGFSNDTNSTSVLPQDNCVEENSNRPSPPILSSRKKAKKFSSVHKELFPFHTANDEISQEQSPSLQCGAMGDITLNALEQICIDSEIKYSINSSKKSNTVTTSFADEATSHFIADSSVELPKNNVIQREKKRNFIYPYENVKKPVTPVLMTDILQTVLSLETNETSTEVTKKNENFCQELVSFTQLESSFSQTVQNSTFSLPSTVWCEAEIDSHNRIAASYEIVRVIYLPVFFCSSDEISITDRDMFTVLKRYFECHRVRFAQLISECGTRARRDLSSTFIDCNRSKFPKLNFSAAIIDSFFEFFILHPNLMYNYRLSRRYLVSSNQIQDFISGVQLSSYSSQGSPSLELCIREVCLSSMKRDLKYSDALFEAPPYQKINKMNEDSTDLNVSGSTVLNQNTSVSEKHPLSDVPMTKNEMLVSCHKSKPKMTDEKMDSSCEKLSPLEPTFTSYKKEMLELGAAFIIASEKYNCVDSEVVERAKKLLEDITAGLARASVKQHFENFVEKSNSANFPGADTLLKVSEKADVQNQNSTELISKTPFDVDIDSADLMFICDISEKTVQPEKSLNFSDVEPFSWKIAKVAKKSPLHHRKASKNLSNNLSSIESPCSVSVETKVTAKVPLVWDHMKYDDSTVASTESSAKSHHVSKSVPVSRSSIKKCPSESSSEREKSLLQAQTMVLDDIENWNPELAVMMTPVEIKKQLIHARSNKTGIVSSSSISESNSTFTNQFAFDAFNTAGGRKINVQPNSIVRAKKSMDSVQIEPEMKDEQLLNGRSMSSVSTLDKIGLNPPHVDDIGKSRTSAEKSNSRRLTKLDNKITTSSCSRDDSQIIVEDESLNHIPELLNTRSCLNKFPSFSTASGKKLSVSEKFLAAGRKIYESTAEEKSMVEIQPNKNDSSRFPPRDSSAIIKMESSGTELISGSKDSVPNIFKNPSASSTVNKFETKSYHQSCGFGSAAGTKLNLAESSPEVGEKLCASISNVAFFENAQDQKFASFSSASGKKISVTGSLLEKGKKLYESTFEETKSCGFECIEKKVNFPKPAQLAVKTAKKMNVIDESLQGARKLFEDCLDDGCLNEFTLNPVDPSSSSQFSSFTSAAGKMINVAERKLFDAQKILQSVSAETMVGMEKMKDLADDFSPSRSKVPSNSKPNSINANEAVPHHQRLKRSLNEDSSQNLPSYSSHKGKKIKTHEDVQKVGGKSEEIVEFKSCEENLETLPSKNEACNKLEPVLFSRTKGEENSVASISESPIDPNLLVDSFSFCGGEDDIFQKSPSLDDTVLLNSDIILSGSDFKADCDLGVTKSAAAVETSSTLLNLSREISESTSAFLFDMKNDNLSFDPVYSPSYSGAVEKPESKAATPEISRSSSPVFDSSKQGHRRKYKKRKSQHTLSLNPLEVTYVRKECDNGASKSTPEEVLKMLNQNFAQKVNKRKEPSSNMMYPSSKKAKDSNENDSILEQRKQAALEQRKLVSQKDEQLCKPRIGSILAEKIRGNRKSLREMVNFAKPQQYSVSKLLQFGLKRSVVNVNADNAHEFFFTADFLSADGATYGDGCTVIPNEKHEVYFEDLARAFLASPGVDPRLISLPWIRNHYRWIIWKLASTERSYPNVFGGRYLTLNNVLLQLKFRYDWEVDRCCRSALKRILECDSSPSEAMILCVASIKTIVASLNEYEIEMTDGWYSVPCLFDGEMLKLLTQKKVTIGTKLVIMNAELTGAGDGCDPLQANPSARLKIATNSVRRARWYVRLGFHLDNPIVISDLEAILPNGGTVPQFTAVIARVYPMLYLDKKDDRSFTLHNEKVHFKKISNYEKRRQMCLDKLVSQITSEVERENPFVDSDDRTADSDSDPVAYQNRRYHEQERLQLLIQERVKQRLPEEFKTPQRTSSMLKVRLINKDAHGDPLPTALLTIWRPPEDLVSLLCEGKLYEFHKIVAGGLRNGQLQLTANRLTKYKHLSAGDLSCYGRRVTSFSELNTDFKAAFGEVDIVGLVISVKEIENDIKSDGSQTIYLADLNKNLMIVKFRTNVKDFGFGDTLKLQNVIAGLNLQWKRSLCNGQAPIVFASELTSFVHNSRCQHLQKCIDKFHSYFKNTSLNDFVTECQEKLKDILSSPGPIATSTPERSNQLTYMANENSVTSESTNDASLKRNNSADSTDTSLNAKSRSVHSRIEKLRGYGEPPPLSPILMCSRRRSSRLSIQTRVQKLSISKN